MSKILILGFALAMMLVSGFFFSAQAGYDGFLSRIGLFSCSSCTGTPERATVRDKDAPNAPCQGAYASGPTTPDPMGSPSVY